MANLRRESVTNLGHRFWLLWTAETSALLGGALLQFAVGVWVFERTESVTDYSLIAVASILAALLALPVAGYVADRFERRLVIVGCDVILAVCMVALAIWIAKDHFNVWTLCVFNATTAAVSAVRSPSYEAAVISLAPRAQLVRVTGALEVSTGVLNACAPLLAAAILQAAGLNAFVMVNLACFFACAMLVWKALPRARPEAVQAHGAIGARVMTGPFGFLREVRGARLLLAYIGLQSGLLALVSTLLGPLVLSRFTVTSLAWVMSSGGVGGVLGAVLLFLVPVRRRLMSIVLVADLILSCVVVSAGLSTSIAVYCACAFIGLFVGSLANICAQALWMHLAPESCRGAALALMSGVSIAATASVLLLGGASIEHLMEPALAPGGVWVDSAFRRIVGGGTGGAISMAFVVCGALSGLFSLLAFTRPSLRRFDDAI